MDINDALKRITEEADVAGYLKGNSIHALEWYKETVQSIENDEKYNDEELLRDKQRQRALPFIGNMYLFKYDPKYKGTLPYYDEMPLVIPIREDSKVPSTFLGLNLHYLSPLQRTKLFNKLLEYRTDDKYNKSTRLLLTYRTLLSVSRAKSFKATIRRYRYEQVNSKFIYIKPIEWNSAIFLPTWRFKGATANEIWNDSRKKF